MSSDVVKNGRISSELSSLIEDTFNLASSSKAPATIKQYESNWGTFLKFCTNHALESLPSATQTVAVYLAHLVREGLAANTVQSHLAAIKHFHDRNRCDFNTDDPLLTETMAGIRRTLGTAQNGSDALLPEDLHRLVRNFPKGKTGLRDKALILLGFAGAFRRSEIVSLTVEDLTFVKQGVLIRLARSKTDQEGKGTKIPVPYGSNPETCPVNTLKAWLAEAGITEGPLFRGISRYGTLSAKALTGEAVRLIVGKAVEAAGLEGKITPHSLRAGFCTAAALAGASLESIQRQARHTKADTTLKYIRIAEQWDNHAGDGLL